MGSPGWPKMTSLLASQTLDNPVDNNSLYDWFDWASRAPLGTQVDVEAYPTNFTDRVAHGHLAGFAEITHELWSPGCGIGALG